MSILLVIIIFSILVVAHEFGHFIAARQAGVKVERFAIGFGPALLKIRRKETDFLICLFPLGGYVKMAGDTKTEHTGLPYEFLSKSPGVKMRIVFAGPLFNYILALVIFWIIAVLGFPYQDTIVGKVLDGYPAQAAGIKEKDKIIKINGVRVEDWQEMAELIRKAEGAVKLTILRNGVTMMVDIPLEKKEIVDNFGIKRRASVIGIVASSEVKFVKYSLPQAFFKGFEKVFSSTLLILKGLVFIFSGALPFKEAVSGPIGIYYITSETVKVGLSATLLLMAGLNVTLATINLFPMPVLDGGHILFFFIERLRKKPLEERIEDFLTRIGIVLISLLVIFVFYNDIKRFGPRILDWKKFNPKTSAEKSVHKE